MVGLFARARDYLAGQKPGLRGRTYAKNVRTVDVTAALNAALTGNVAAGDQAVNWGAAGSYLGPLSGNGAKAQMPGGSAGIIIGAAVLFPYLETSALAASVPLQVIGQQSLLVARVGNNPIFASHTTFNARFIGAGNGIAVGPLLGFGQQLYGTEPETQPGHLVKPSDDVELLLTVRSALVLGAVTCTPQLMLRMVVADEGQDS
jgi:hypothetical protein